MIDPDYPGHQWHWVMSALAAHARAVVVQAIDGPYVDFHDREGYLESARCSASTASGAFTRTRSSEFTLSEELYEEAERVLAAYAEAMAAGRGAAVLDGKMIDEATRKLAEKLAAHGRAAGLRRRSS